MRDKNLSGPDQSAGYTEPSDGHVKAMLRDGQRVIIHRILRVVVILGILTLAAGLYNFFTSGESQRLAIIAIVYLVILAVTYVPGIAYGVQTGVLLCLLYGGGVYNLLLAGSTGNGTVNGVLFLLAIPVSAALFFDRRVGILWSILAAVTVATFAILSITGFVNVPPETLPGLGDAGSWIFTGVAFILLVAMVTIPQYDIIQHLSRALTQENELTRALLLERASLEKQVDERTKIIARRARYLEASAIVAREASSVIDNPDALMLRVVNVISERFGFYHTGLFLNDAGGEWAELKAASGVWGQLLLAKGHRLLIGLQGIVGYVAQHGQARIALDVGEDAVFFDNPNLPETRSEIALPLLVRGQVIGVLDVQSTEKQAFTEDDSSVLQSLADQIALAISNARLLGLAQKSIAAERRLRGDLSLDGWRKLLQSERELSARSRSAGLSSTGEVWYPEMGAALHESKPVVDNETQRRVAIPLQVAGHTIGVIAARKSASAGRWSASEILLLDSLTEQLNAVVERARLYRQAQHAASRQRTVADVGARLRASLHMETMLQSAANEIREAMNLSDVEIRLAKPVVAPDEADLTADEDEVGV